MYAEPTMPNTSVTPLAARVSTRASDGVMRWGVGAVTACLRCAGAWILERRADGRPRHDSLSAGREYQGLPKRLRPT